VVYPLRLGVVNVIGSSTLGRKKYLFAGSHEAAKRSGILYCLPGKCKMHGIEPYRWIEDILSRIPNHSINKIKELLPHHWKRLA
jgi:transposase